MLQNNENVINDFSGDYEFLRSDYPCMITFEDDLFPSVEHAFQAAKTNDAALRQQIRGAISGSEAKRIGRKLTLSGDWRDQRLDIMAGLVRQKFTEHLDLKIKLLLTGLKELIQGNAQEQFWGQIADGSGENHLGKILMRTRAAIRVMDGSAFAVLDQYLRSRAMEEVANDLSGLLTLAEVILKYKDEQHLFYKQLDLNQIQQLLFSLK